MDDITTVDDEHIGTGIVLSGGVLVSPGQVWQRTSVSWMKREQRRYTYQELPGSLLPSLFLLPPAPLLLFVTSFLLQSKFVFAFSHPHTVAHIKGSATASNNDLANTGSEQE